MSKSKETAPKKSSERRPPEITVNGSTSDFLVAALAKYKGKFHLRLFKSCIRVYAYNPDVWNGVMAILRENNVDFFSHPQRGNGVLNVVLKNMPHVSTDTVKSELIACNVEAIAVRSFPTLGNAAWFGIDFDKSKVSLSFLKENVRCVFSLHRYENRLDQLFAAIARCSATEALSAIALPAAIDAPGHIW